jgi:hypothetical protein
MTGNSSRKKRDGRCPYDNQLKGSAVMPEAGTSMYCPMRRDEFNLVQYTQAVLDGKRLARSRKTRCLSSKHYSL